MAGTFWVRWGGLGLLICGLWLRAARPPVALPCAQGDLRFQVEDRLPRVVCDPERRAFRPPIGWARSLGLSLPLNAVGEGELARLPGVGRVLARSLVERRSRVGGFSDWGQVKRVRGVGQVKLQTLQRALRLDP